MCPILLKKRAELEVGSGGWDGTPVEPSPHQDIDFKILFFSQCTPRALQTLQASHMAMTSGESGILVTSSKLVSTVTARPSEHRRYHPAQI